MTLGSRARDPQQRRRDDRSAAAYRRALARSRAAVVALRPDAGADALDSLDGLLLTGGGDLDPACYGGAPHPALREVDVARDRLELAAAREALRRGMPVLGICRGAQVLGVALGGRLVQDIPTEVAGAERHAPRGRGEVARHWVQIAPDSLLARILGARRVRVNSAHHQANGEPGPGVKVVARSPDGVVEAIEAEGGGFAVGVQWHPERMPRAPRQRRLLEAFVQAARAAHYIGVR